MVDYKTLSKLLESEFNKMNNKAHSQAQMIAIDAVDYIKKIFLCWYYEKTDEEVFKLKIDKVGAGCIQICYKKDYFSTETIFRVFELNMDPDWATCVKGAYCAALRNEIYHLTQINWFEGYIERTKL